MVSILLSADLWLSVGLGVALWHFPRFFDVGTTTVGTIVSVLLTYGAVALGFCLTGLVLAVTLPSQHFAQTLVGTIDPQSKLDTYTKLVHVFTWAAACHWVLLIYSIIWLTTVGSDKQIATIALGRGGLVAASVLAGLGLYCFFRFFIVIITVAQASTTYIQVIKRPQPVTPKLPRKRPSPRSVADESSSNRPVETVVNGLTADNMDPPVLPTQE
jgi:hypothetical protein